MTSGKGRSKDSFQDLLRTALNKPHSARANQVFGYKRAHDDARPAHLGALIAATPQILHMIRGAATARLLPEL